MDCRRIEELIPLYVEGDLGEPGAAGVRSHLQGCEACRALVAEFEASQAWLREAEPPDFDDAFVDTVRAGVMRELAASEAAPPFVERLREWLAPRRPAVAALALTIIFIAFLLLVYSGRSRVVQQENLTAHETPAPNKHDEGDDTKPAPTALSEKEHRIHRTPRRAALALAGPSRHKVRRVGAPHDAALARRQPDALPDMATGDDEKLRIEIQTADPNIRIIWFAPKPSDADAPNLMGDTR